MIDSNILNVAFGSLLRDAGEYTSTIQDKSVDAGFKIQYLLTKSDLDSAGRRCITLVKHTVYPAGSESSQELEVRWYDASEVEIYV
jgi:hypothetical protein